MQVLLKLIMYFMTLSLLMGVNNWLMLFLCLEMNLIMLVWILKKNNMKFKLNFLMKYSLIQGMNSLMLITSLLLYSNWMNYGVLMITALILMKMGLPPLFLWMKELIKFMSMKTLMVILFIQKLPFFIILAMLKKEEFMLPVVVVLTVMSAILLYNQSSFNEVFFYSSMTHSMLLLMIMTLSKKLFLLYLFLYTFMIIFLFLMLKNKFDLLHMSKHSFVKTVLFLFLLGLPPSPMFFMKIFFLMKMLSTLSIFMVLMLTISIVITMIIYFSWSLTLFSSINQTFYTYQQSKFHYLSYILMFIITVVLLI